MSAFTQHARNRFLGAIAMLLCATLLACGLAPAAAHAADAPDAVDITVHKRSAVADGGTPNVSGEELPGAISGLPLPGATFGLYRVDASSLDFVGSDGSRDTVIGQATCGEAGVVPDSIAVTVQQQRAHADGTWADEGAPHTVNLPVQNSPAREGVTDAHGVIGWTGVEAGPSTWYVLVETGVPAIHAVTANAVITTTLSKADGSGFVTDIHVYPKDVRAEVPGLTKTADVPAAGVFGTVSWTIEHPTPLPLKAQDASGVTVYAHDYFITDTLDARLDFVAASSKVTLLDAAGQPLAPTMSEGVDFRVSYDEASRTLTWRFVEGVAGCGVQKVADAEAASVRIAFDTVVNERALDDASVIENGAHLEFVNATGDPATLDLVEKARVEVGGIVVTKYDGRAPSTMLAGAAFKVAASRADAEKGVFLQRTDGEGRRVDVEVVTDALGEARFAGLAPGTWYLVETASPEGYTRITQPIEVTIGTDDPMVGIAVPNEKAPGAAGDSPACTLIKQLTKTGDGVGLLFAALLVIAAVAGVVVWRTRKERR